MKKLLLVIFLISIYSNSFSQKIIKVQAGLDSISTAYEAASAGDIIELVTDGGNYQETNDFVVEKGKPITVRAAKGLVSKPRWSANAGWALILPADGITIKGIVLDGKLGSSTREVIIRGAEVEWYELKIGANLKLYDCDFINGGYGIYGEDQNQLDTVVISGCTFKDLNKTAVQYIIGKIPPGQVKNFICDNTTFSNIQGNAISLVATSLDVNPQINFLVNHVTVHNTTEAGIEVTSIDGAVIKNSIFTSSAVTPMSAFAIHGTKSAVSNVLYNNLAEIGLLDGATAAQLQNIQAGVDPLYASPVSGNFTLMAGSPAINAGDDGKSLGDARWWPENNTEFVFVSEGDNKISAALASAVDGQTIVLTTDGGIYNEAATLIVDKKLKIKAADGMSKKPLLTSGSKNAMIEFSADFLLQGVILDGAKGAEKTAIGITNKPNTTGYDLAVLGTDFLNFEDSPATKGFGIFGDPSSVVDSVYIHNCYFAHIYNMGISYNDPLTATGSVNFFTVDNCTFWDMNSEAIYVDGNDSKVDTKDPLVNINKVTAYDCGSYVIIPHYIDYAVITNTIVALPELNTSFAPAKLYGTHSKIENFLYFNTRDIDLSSGATDFQLINVKIQEDPLFTDPANGVFSYSLKSPAVIFKGAEEVQFLGDDRWWPSISFPSNIHLGTKHNSLNGLTVSWNNQTTNDSLRWGYTTDYEKGTFPGVKRNNYKVGENPEYLFDYTFPVVKPSSTIYYSIKFNDLWGEQKTFKTSVDTASTKFTFIAGGDQQVGKEKWQKISTMAANEAADFYIMAGDIVDNSLYPSMWEEYYDFGKEFLQKSLTYYTWGNHIYYDTQSGLAAMNQFVLPGNEKWYSFKQGNTLFICLLSEATLSSQVTFIKDLLSKTDATWKVVYFHKPFFTAGGHAGEMDAAIPTWWKAFDDYGVNVILNGHEHTYTRSKPINLNVSKTTGVAEYGSKAGQGRLQFQTGSMGASVYGDQDGWWVAKMKSVVNYVKFSVDGDKMHFESIDENGVIVDSLTLAASGTSTTAVQNSDNKVPTTYQMYQNFPNPFNPSTTITYSLPATGKVVLKVYNVLGSEIATLVNEEKIAGTYSMNFNASSLSSGVYYYKIQAGTYSETRKMVFLK